MKKYTHMYPFIYDYENVMSTDPRKQSPSSASPAGLKQVTRALPPIVKQVRDNSLSILINQLTEFFVSCDDLFFELAGKAGTNKEQNDFFDTMREIRISKKQNAKSLALLIPIPTIFSMNFSALCKETVLNSLLSLYPITCIVKVGLSTMTW